MDSKKRVYNENPYNKANFISKIFFCWISPLLEIGRKRVLSEDDLYAPLEHEDAKYLVDQIEIEWNKEKLKTKPSLFNVLVRLYKRTIIISVILNFFKEAVLILMPILISLLLEYFNDERDIVWAVLFGLFICLTTFLYMILNQVQLFPLIRCGIKIRLGVCGLTYKKLMKVGISDKKSNVEFLNLLSTDASRLENSTISISYLFIAPLKLIAIVIILAVQINYTILSGLLVLLLFIPLQVFLSRLLSKYRMRAAKITDERINLTTEVLNGMKVIKMYCWENAFNRIIKMIRIRELKNLGVIFIVIASNNLIEAVLPQLMSYVSIAVFTSTSKSPLSPGYIVLIVSYYISLCFTFAFQFMRAITQIISARVSLKRIENYLSQTEIESREYDNTSKKNINSIEVKSLSASWLNNSTTDLLQNISFTVESNKLVGIIGSVGSGKTSLLMALLGEMPNVKGDVNVNGSVFYVSQEPWIFSATVKQNILFGKEYKESKFNKVVNVCELREDLQMLPDAENTYIGDKGVNLSGGQRARISLARALYSDADIYLLDDPLSAVDANVGRKIYNNCINGYLKSKIRILVTHQVHFLTDADNILVIKEGTIASCGTYNELLTNSDEMNLLLHSVDIQETNKNAESQIKKYASEKSLDDNSNLEKNEDNMIEIKKKVDNEANQEKHKEFMESKQIGDVSWSVYGSYFKSVLGYLSPVIIIFLFISTQGLLIGADYWAAYWANAEEKQLNGTFCGNSSCVFTKRHEYLIYYTSIIVCGIVMAIIRSIVFYGFCLLATKRLHDKMLTSVMGTKIRFFDLNPIGRILNRFTKDIGHLDDDLPLTLFEFLLYGIRVLGIIVLAVIANYFVAIPLLPLFALFIYIRRYFISSSQEIKRIEGLCRSPIFVHATNTTSGIVTIRACRNQGEMLDEFNGHCNHHTRAFFAFVSVNRWFAIRLDGIVVIYTCLVIFGCVFLKNFMNLQSSDVGISLTYVIQAMGLFQWAVRQSAEVTNFMTSAERIDEYGTLEQETSKDTEKNPDKDWPQNGEIEFKDVSFAYDENLPNVLKNVSFKISAKEKIGVVGRTGAGKSTIFQTLFRMAEPTGTVLIDGINIKNISLHDLRSKISIIPQEPTLFIGPLRYNLDPFGEHDDKVLWDTLDIVQLKDAVKSMDGGLDALIQKGGSNLSVGQKQLICLARAILKKSKILIIDEATANVDYNTDELVQKAIRECFGDSTVITIAHRLHTIMDTDKIICLSDGKLIDIGRPYDLLLNQVSVLYKLIQKLDENEQKFLFQIAKSHAIDAEGISNSSKSDNNSDDSGWDISE